MSQHFENVFVSLNGQKVFCDEASFEESIESSRQESLGSNTATLQHSSFPKNSLRGSMFLQTGFNASSLTGRLIDTWVGQTGVRGILTSFSTSVAPDNLLKANFAVEEFGASQLTGSPPSDNPPVDQLSFLGGKDVTLSGMSCLVMGLDYSITQNVTPHFKLGQNTILKLGIRGSINTTVNSVSGIGNVTACLSDSSTKLLVSGYCNSGSITWPNLNEKITAKSSGNNINDVPVITTTSQGEYGFVI